jgi:hypothetical protein
LQLGCQCQAYSLKEIGEHCNFLGESHVVLAFDCSSL